MSEHTPGPWKTQRLYPLPADIRPGGYQTMVFGGEREEVARVLWQSGACVGVIDPSTGIANARLIAAAPDLLAELKRLVDSVDEAGWHRSETCEAHAAIAKAEGKE